jgi:flagellar biosynthesis/type III secretory pathway protein FliH
MEVLDMLTQDEVERERYRARVKAQRDHISFVQDAREEGLEKGRAEGLVKGHAEGHQAGLQQGELIGQIHAYQRLLKLPLTPREELLAHSPADLAAQVDSLEHLLAT